MAGAGLVSWPVYNPCEGGSPATTTDAQLCFRGMGDRDRARGKIDSPPLVAGEALRWWQEGYDGLKPTDESSAGEIKQFLKRRGPPYPCIPKMNDD